MSQNEGFVLTVTKTKVVVSQVKQEDNALVVRDKIQVHWETDKLAAAFDQALEGIDAESLRCVVDDELCYVVGLQELPENFEDEKVEHLLQAHIPETLRRTYWDYSFNSHDGNNVLQAYAFTQQFSDEIHRAVDLSKVQLEVIEPASLSLSRQLFEESPTHILLHHDASMKLGIFAQNEVVMTVVRFPEEIRESDLQNFVDHIQEKYGVSSIPLYVSGFPSSVIKTTSFRVLPVTVSSAMGILKKKQITGGSRKELNVALGLTESDKALSPVEAHDKKRAFSVSNKIIVGALISVAIIGILVGVFVSLRLDNSKDISGISPVVEDQESAQDVVVFSDYSIAISPEIKGYEVIVSDLQQSEFRVETFGSSGSATSSSQSAEAVEATEAAEVSPSAKENTEVQKELLEIQYKPGVSNLVLDEIDAVLGDFDTTYVELTPESGYDVLITVTKV